MGALTPADQPLDEKAVAAEAERALADIAAIKAETAKVIFGQEKVVEQTVLAILSGGHALLVGVPGLAKTKLVATLATVLGLNTSRIQFTPDLMLPLRQGTGIHRTADGRRNQPRQPAHPVSSPAGDAGISRDHHRPAL
jgi:MoxR-like ATPase